MSTSGGRLAGGVCEAQAGVQEGRHGYGRQRRRRQRGGRRGRGHVGSPGRGAERAGASRILSYNPNGRAIEQGHAIAATGAIITTKILGEMERNDHKLGLVSLCIGGGQGIAMLLERD
jgi:acetyl-CoA acetyltransferase